MVDFGRVLAGVVAAVCVLLLVRLAVGPRRRARIDRVLADAWSTWRLRLEGLWRWRAHRKARAEAERVTRQVIDRARQAPKVRKEGNVYTPDAFRDPRKPD